MISLWKYLSLHLLILVFNRVAKVLILIDTFIQTPKQAKDLDLFLAVWQHPLYQLLVKLSRPLPIKSRAKASESNLTLDYAQVEFEKFTSPTLKDGKVCKL